VAAAAAVEADTNRILLILQDVEAEEEDAFRNSSNSHTVEETAEPRHIHRLNSIIVLGIGNKWPRHNQKLATVSFCVERTLTVFH
jgi:hypothetical protein